MSYGSIIAAISTPSGKGGVALIRVSGEGAIELCEKAFIPKSKIPLSKAKPRTLVYGDIIKNGEIIDDGMAAIFKAPASYTGEDTVEITCHGGLLITERVLESILVLGAKLAERGEFTERAFINGKLSLTDAEAIGNLLEAKSDEQIKLASGGAREKLSSAIGELRKELTSLLASIFARIDYPDEDLGDFTNEETLESLINIKESIDTLLSTYPTAKAINEGVRTVICGKTNVGKSSLYNAILCEDAAIVTDIEGTTRDVLSSEISLGKVMLKLSDTAGVRDTSRADTVEKIGIERSIAALKSAELIIAVFDGSRSLDGDDEELISKLKEASGAKIAVINKADLESKIDKGRFSDFDSVLEISAKEEPAKAKTKISEVVNRLFIDEKIRPGEEAVITSARQNSALISSREYVNAAITALRAGEFTDAAASEIELALGKLSELDGKAVAEEVLSEIFDKFCVGK